MAENLFLLKRRIRTAKNIAQIAKAMEMVSASKIKKAQTAVENNKPYAQRITALTEDLLSRVDLEKYSHPYLTQKGEGKTLLFIFSPDKGLCGSLNTNLYKKVLEFDEKDAMVVTLGKKAEWFATRRGMQLIASFPMGTALPSYSLVFQFTRLIEQQLKSGEITQVKIMYTEFESFFNQYPHLIQILPIEKHEHEKTDNEEMSELPFLVEPNLEEILDSLLPHYLEIKIFQTLIEAYTSEQAARMVAMQNAKNNALDVADFLTLTYNKRRQERITNEILDLANSKTT